ncbi:hypothetical protein MMYC01_201653 [Madurella mycetomatis]|uniref:Uncharacterized protein n=1 Tax=Madurella mycetomatis TaxID=100816 RepID=A0A175WFE7_9PEZI|nr:hypothetical protein MMYC01_201653 [Madurella mycetomatis]
MLSTTDEHPVQEQGPTSGRNKLLSVVVESSCESHLRLVAPGFEPITIVVEDHAPSEPQHAGFLDWTKFDEATLPPKANPRKSRLRKLFSPLNSIKAELPGNVTVEGLGGAIESAHNLFHSVRRLDFMESERRIYLPPEASLGLQNLPRRRELERFENELFDVSKYNGSCDYLTALAWAEESFCGSITLYRVLFDEVDGKMTGIRPVAAMRDVPIPVLVRMRTHETVKRKVVFVPVDEDAGSFRWSANPSRGPTYVKLNNAARSLPPPRSPGRSRSRSRSRHGSSRLADADGVCATIPQFLALLHAARSILEDVKSNNVAPLGTEDGDVKSAVALIDPPRPNPHAGGSVHVAVLLPNDAPWADEEIVWTDQNGLAEFRQRKYWDLIDLPSPRKSRGRSRSRARGWSRSRSRHPSHSRHGSRSQSRHVY